MPQMYPSWWLFIYLFTILMIFLMMSKIFFLKK